VFERAVCPDHGGEKTGSVHELGRFRENLDVEHRCLVYALDLSSFSNVLRIHHECLLAGRSCGVWDLDISTMTRRYRVLLRQGTVE